MGVIQRQGIKNSLVNFFGIALGFFATLFIYPLDWELYGSIQYWISSATLLVPILRFGSTALVPKFYPHFKENNISGFLGMVLLVTALSIVGMSLVILVLAFIFQDSGFLEKLQLNSGDALLIYFLSLGLIATNIFQLQAANSRRIVVPDLISKIGLKIFLILVVLGSYYGFMSEELAGPLLVLFHFGSALLLLIYIISLDQFTIGGFKWKSLKPQVKRDIRNYWFLGILNSLGLMLAYKIDIFIIGSTLDNVSVGYYSTFLFMTSIMMVPMNAVNQISAPEISECFEKDDIPRIERIYQKTSNNLLVIGSVILITIWIGILFLLDIMSNGSDLIPFIYSLLFLGIAKIFDLSTSVNNLIINYSKWYHYNLFFLFIVSTLNITLNLLFIDSFGIVGVSLATMSSLLIYNALKTLFIYKKLNIQPFNRKSIVIFSILTIGLLAASLLQDTRLFSDQKLNLVIYCGGAGFLFSLLFYLLKISPELNAVADNLLKRTRK